MALKGNLNDFSLTQLLNLVNLARKTGALHLTKSSSSDGELFFREGKLIDARLKGQRHELTTLLYRIGKISAEQEKTILSHASVRTDKELALLLINANLATQSDIVQAVRSHLLDTIYLMFTWSDGTFFFEPAVLPPEDSITVPIHLEGVIMEGTRRVQEWEMLQDELPDLDMALRFSERPSTNLREIHLSVDEWRVISFINPRNSIRQIADVNKMNDFQIRKIVYRMMQAGLVTLTQPQGAPPKRLFSQLPEGTAPAPKQNSKQSAEPAPTLEALRPASSASTVAGGETPPLHITNLSAAPSGPPALAPTSNPSPLPSRNVVMRLINRIRQL